MSEERKKEISLFMNLFQSEIRNKHKFIFFSRKSKSRSIRTGIGITPDLFPLKTVLTSLHKANWPSRFDSADRASDLLPAEELLFLVRFSSLFSLPLSFFLSLLPPPSFFSLPLSPLPPLSFSFCFCLLHSFPLLLHLSSSFKVSCTNQPINQSIHPSIHPSIH